MIHLPYIHIDFHHFLSCGIMFSSFKCVGDDTRSVRFALLKKTVDLFLRRGYAAQFYTLVNYFLNDFKYMIFNAN